MSHDNIHIYSYVSDRGHDIRHISRFLSSNGGVPHANQERIRHQKKSKMHVAPSERSAVVQPALRETDRVMKCEIRNILNTTAPYRRTSSYLPYRTPRRIKIMRQEKKRSRAQVEMESSCVEHKAKRCKVAAIPRFRKQKRRIHSFSERCDWLSTHIWHAKRMCMSREFGISMASYNRCRGITRKLTDSLAHHAVLHDSSYFKPIEIRGDRLALAQLLRLVTDPACDILVDHGDNDPASHEDSEIDEPNRQYASSVEMREVHMMLYKSGAFPASCIGPCTLSLLPTLGGGHSRIVWVWLHPCMYHVAHTELQAAAAVVQSVVVERVVDPPARFAIRGVRSLDVLKRTLRPAMAQDTGHMENSTGAFFASLCNVPERAISRLWPVGHALALQAQGLMGESGRPLESKRKKNILVWPDAHTNIMCSEWLLHASKRQTIREKMSTVTDLNKIREQKRNVLYSIVDKKSPSTDLSRPSDNLQTPVKAEKIAENIAHIPVMLIRVNESSSMAGYSTPALFRRQYAMSGFDVLLPQCYANRVWSALLLQGSKRPLYESKTSEHPLVRAVGFKEMDFLRLNAGIPSFPRDFPETNSGTEYWDKRRKDIERLESKKPMQKRLPPVCWKVPNLYGLMETSVKSMNMGGQSDMPQMLVVRSARYSESFRRPEVSKPNGDWNRREPLPSLQNMLHPTCVSVLLVPCSRGVVVDGASILMPTVADYELYIKHEKSKLFASSESNIVQGAWKGSPSAKKLERQVIGVITSGASREGKGRDRGATSPTDRRFAIGLCRIDLLQLAMSLSHEFGAATERTLILFSNPERRSGFTGESANGWVRPALCHINSVNF